MLTKSIMYSRLGVYTSNSRDNMHIQFKLFMINILLCIIQPDTAH